MVGRGLTGFYFYFFFLLPGAELILYQEFQVVVAESAESSWNLFLWLSLQDNVGT